MRVKANIYDNSAGVSGGPSQVQIISAIYETVIQPQCYDRFSQYRLEEQKDTEGSPARSCNPARVSPQFSFHFSKAFEILRDRWVKRRCPDPAYVYEDGGGVWVVTTSSGRALRCSRRARQDIGVLPQDVLKTFDADTLPNRRAWERFMDRLRSGRFSWDDFFVLKTRQPGMMLLCRPISGGSVVAEPALVMVEALDIPFFHGAIPYLAKGFCLDDQQSDALAGLLQGGEAYFQGPLGEAATGAIAKAGAPGGAELIRLAALLIKEQASDMAIASGDRMPTSSTILCSNGTRLQYLRLGAETGKSVIFMHGLLDCVAGIMRLQPHFRRLGFRVYVPLRNGYGASGPVPKQDRHLEVFSEQIGVLLDREEIQRPILLAHRGGVVFAHAVAKRWRNRVGGIVAVSPSGRMKTIGDFATLQGYQRAFALCSSLARPLLPLLMRSWSRSVRRKGVEVLLTRQSTSGRLDAGVVANMNLAPLLRHSHDFAMKQGGAGFIADIDLVMRDWWPMVAGRTGADPVVYLCGREEPGAGAGRPVFGTGQNVQYRLCEGSDGTLLYTRPELILAALQDLANRTAQPDGQKEASAASGPNT